MKLRPICIYHADCPDGFASACIVNAVMYIKPKLFAGVYNEHPPSLNVLKNRDIIIVDFSYPKDVIIEIAKVAKRVIIIDHHKTAIENLTNLPSNVETVFDTEHCGAYLTWQYFFSSKPVPKIILHLEDNDLHKLLIKDSQKVYRSILAAPYTLKSYEELFETPIEKLIARGSILLDYHRLCVKRAAEQRELIDLAGYEVWAVNVPHFLASDVANVLTQSKPFGAAYYIIKGQVYVSLRSRSPNGLDVAKLATCYGGGGHKHAAGFSVSLQSWVDGI